MTKICVRCKGVFLFFIGRCSHIRDIFRRSQTHRSRQCHQASSLSPTLKRPLSCLTPFWYWVLMFRSQGIRSIIAPHSSNYSGAVWFFFCFLFFFLFKKLSLRLLDLQGHELPLKQSWDVLREGTETLRFGYLLPNYLYRGEGG